MAHTIAIMTPGAMGQAVGTLLGQHGRQVISNLADRSTATCARAAQAGIEDAGSDTAVLARADVLLSILVPAEAKALAERFAAAATGVSSTPLYVDCNAVAPATTARIADIVTAAGMDFVDGGIIGPPPAPDSTTTRIYVSGPRAHELLSLNEAGLDVRVLSERIGDASALKMCYAALTKGFVALATQLNTAANRLGVQDALWREFEHSQGEQFARMRRELPIMVPKAHRWVGEMGEIADTLRDCGLSGAMLEGAASTYELVSEVLGEDPDGLDFETVVARLADSLGERGRR